MELTSKAFAKSKHRGGGGKHRGHRGHRQHGQGGSSAADQLAGGAATSEDDSEAAGSDAEHENPSLSTGADLQELLQDAHTDGAYYRYRAIEGTLLEEVLPDTAAAQELVLDLQQLARSLSAVSTSGLLGLPTEYTQCLTAKDMEALGLQGAQRSSTDSAATAAGQTSPAKPASQLQPAVVQSSSQTQAPKPRMSTTGGPASAARPPIPVTTTTTSSLAPGKPTAPAQPQPTASKPQPHSVTDDDFLDDLLGERASATRPTHTNTAALVKPQIPAAKPAQTPSQAPPQSKQASQSLEDWLGI